MGSAADNSSASKPAVNDGDGTPAETPGSGAYVLVHASRYFHS